MTILLLAATGAAVAGAQQGADPTLKSVSERVVCQCGCNYGLNYCPHQNCSSHDEMKAFIEKERAAGKDQAAILQALVDRYGVKVLAAPPAQGFNLVAWVLPGVGLLVGFILVAVVVRRLRRPLEKPAAAEASGLDPKLLAEIEEEMKTSGLGIRD